ncbi:MAG: hypothetical protein U0X74_00460 [Anaerolineales bacterium]
MNKKRRSINSQLSTKERHFWAKEIILPVILAILASGGIIVTLISNSKSKQSSSGEPMRIQIQEDYYHIGNVEAVTVIQDGKIVGATPFSHPSPESNPFVKEIDLPYLPKSATFYITAKSIDTDEKNSGVKIFINGVFFDYLNRYYSDETMDEKTVFIPVDRSFLREGKNTIQIFVESGREGFIENLDDIEFKNVYLEINP